MIIFDKLLDKNNGERRRIEEFGRIFIMESYTSIAGVVVTLLWFFMASSFSVYIKAFGIYFYTTAAFFLVLAIFGIYSFIQNKDRNANLRGDHDRDVSVRKQVIFLSLFNTLVFGLLIFLTGGVLSAVVPLYAMTFTLTISEARAPRPTTVAFFLYAVVLLISSSYWAFDLIGRETIVQLSSRQEFYSGILILSILSLFVPYTALLVTRPKSLGSASKVDGNPAAGQIDAE